ncbi:hypothetical protein PT285_08025 [Lactobacillus sp. ESL0791]|uniref:aggregation-promoting factor n=1 Tax=Lactobacillus sp. ESL0791 TaxID=2983234 RepID=UPI0023F6A85A|nr:hypothetical protein [Lactobacillus sp. ESL0791]MDF7639343.1 hypothetical protein [Lactobacillus sp. ESL0791]
MKIKSILVKQAAVAALSVAGIVAVNNVSADNAQAATVANDAKVVTVNYVEGNTIKVWDSYKHPKATGQVLSSNSSWKVIKTARDSAGHKWYDLGKNQWVMAKYVNPGYEPENAAPAADDQTSNTVNDANDAVSTNTAATDNVTATPNVASDSDASAKAWIANQESGGSYSVQNGQYVGKYQLSASYLNGDYSAANQEQAADNYVTSRYGSWAAAKAFWQANGWY